MTGDDDLIDEVFGADARAESEFDEPTFGIDLPTFARADHNPEETLGLDRLRLPNASATLREHVARSVEAYFELLEGESASDLYPLVLAEVEAPLLAAVMRHTRGNQSKAAIVLGLNRGTLRTKLRQHRLL